MIYFDNAATTPLDKEVLAEMMPYMTEYYGNASSIHALGRQSRAAVEKARKTIAQHLNASTGELFFTSGGTEANNTVLTGAIKDLNIRHIITGPIEHHCVLHTLEHLEKSYDDIQIHYVDLLPDGHINTAHLEQQLEYLQYEKVLVSLMYVNNELGNILDIEKVAALCNQYDAYFHSDTVQAIGVLPIDLQETKIHFLAGSAHKLHGPKGTGFLYINNDVNISPFISGGSQERNMRAGTECVFGIAGLGKAVDMAYTGLETNKQYIQSLKTYLIEQLETNIPEVQFNGDAKGRSSYKILNVSFPPGPHNNLLLLHLDIEGICASGGSACSSGADAGSHVIKNLEVAPERTNIRFSFSKYNTKEELDVLMKKLLYILKLNTDVEAETTKQI